MTWDLPELSMTHVSSLELSKCWILARRGAQEDLGIYRETYHSSDSLRGQKEYCGVRTLVHIRIDSSSLYPLPQSKIECLLENRAINRY